MHAILHNQHMTPADRIIFYALEEVYPAVRTERVCVELWRVSKVCHISIKAIGRFLQSMYQCGYMDYEVKTVTTLENGVFRYKRESYVLELEACNRPWELDLVNAPQRKERNRKQRERMRCLACGSDNMQLLRKVSAICMDCGTEQE